MATPQMKANSPAGIRAAAKKAGKTPLDLATAGDHPDSGNYMKLLKKVRPGSKK